MEGPQKEGSRHCGVRGEEGGGARHSHLRTADEYNNLIQNNLIQLQSLVSIREDVQKVTRGLFVCLKSWWIFFQL